MTRVLILGANGHLARNTTRVLLDNPALTLTLYLRRASRLKNPAADRVTIVEGDVLDAATRHAMQARDLCSDSKLFVVPESCGIGRFLLWHIHSETGDVAPSTACYLFL
jgi:nucleoside-diphosphate-sugar epimerase